MKQSFSTCINNYILRQRIKKDFDVSNSYEVKIISDLNHENTSPIKCYFKNNFSFETEQDYNLFEVEKVPKH